MQPSEKQERMIGKGSVQTARVRFVLCLETEQTVYVPKPAAVLQARRWNRSLGFFSPQPSRVTKLGQASLTSTDSSLSSPLTWVQHAARLNIRRICRSGISLVLATDCPPCLFRISGRPTASLHADSPWKTPTIFPATASFGARDFGPRARSLWIEPLMALYAKSRRTAMRRACALALGQAVE